MSNQETSGNAVMPWAGPFVDIDRFTVGFDETMPDDQAERAGRVMRHAAAHVVAAGQELNMVLNAEGVWVDAASGEAGPPIAEWYRDIEDPDSATYKRFEAILTNEAWAPKMYAELQDGFRHQPMPGELNETH